MMALFFYIAHEVMKRVLNFMRNPKLANVLVNNVLPPQAYEAFENACEAGRLDEFLRKED